MRTPLEPTVDYILRSERNSELALQILAAGDAIRQAMIERFVTRLDAHLRQQFSEPWQVHNDLIDDVLAPWGKIYVQKANWRGSYRIGLCAEQRLGQDVFIGVWCDREQISENHDEGRLQAELEQPHHQGGWSRDWPYRYRADPLYRHWVKHETLLRINHNQGQEVIDYFSQELAHATLKAGPVIDYALNWT